MNSDVNYFKIDSSTKFDSIDDDYQVKLTMQLYTTLSTVQEDSVGKEINKFFNGILSKNDGDLFEINQAVTAQVLDDDPISFDALASSIDNILNTSYSDLQLTFDHRTIEDISNVLFFSFNKIKQYDNFYNIKTQADFLSSLFEINFHDVDIVKEYSTKEIPTRSRAGSKRSLYKNSFMHSKANLSHNRMHEQFSSFLHKNDSSFGFSNFDCSYKYYKSDIEMYPLPNEMIILVNKLQYIRRVNFSIEIISDDKLIAYIIILLNVGWLFPNLIEVEFDLTCELMSTGLDYIFKQKLSEKMKEINKILKTTRYDTYKIPSVGRRSNKWDVNMSRSMSMPSRASFVTCNTTMVSEQTISNKIEVSDDDNVFLTSKNGISGVQIVKDNSVKLDMIIIYSYFISKWSNVKVLMLRFPDSFSRELETSLIEKKLTFFNINFMNFFVGVDQLIDLSVEFNALDSHNFEKILGMINNNKTLRILRMSMFSSDRDYSPSGLFKLCYGMKMPINKFFFERKTLHQNYLCDDIDHVIIWKLLDAFETNLEFLFCVLLNKRNLSEFTFVLDLPPILIEEDGYIITMIKFIINFLLLVSFEAHKFSVIKIIAPLLLFDSRKYPIITNFLSEIDESNQKNLQCITNLTIQLKFFCVEQITNLFTTRITSLFLGDLDYVTFVAFANYYAKENFTQQSMLITLKLSLGVFIIDYKSMEKYLKMIYQAVPRYLSEHMIFSNLVVKKENVEELLNIINFNPVTKYLLEYNFKSAKNIFDVNTALYSSNCKDSRNKLRLLLKTIINRDSDKEKNKKMFTQIVAYFLNKKEIVLQTKEEYE